MSPQQYQRVKEIFLAACDKPLTERDAYIQQAVGADAEVRREVASLLKEHSRETQMIPDNPEPPMGSMSAILSRANIDLGNANERAAAAVEDGARSAPDPRRNTDDYLDESNPSSSSNSGYVDAGRFMAGTVAAARYRIIELLGRGGMGEVYRADDLTLNQSVALKFLPALFGQDQTWLNRFHNEVRLARQVTHPNVCRVFDIGEFQGEQFLSMEYIDGENLASLLRRIGRLPHDKGLQIARQLCAGLSAAHDRGVLHRDLKPANVMIDGRGSVRITDFGLAAPADQLRKEAGGALRAGTPAYMSPEQLAGRTITIRSDVYSLGLLLYEMFTGKRAFRGESMRDYQKLHSSEQPTPPSEIVPDIDPIVERVILRCLEKDPRNRPASAMAVSAGLPGGDPLREILAAGETPSPEVVAAAGEAHRGLNRWTAFAYLAAGLVSLLIVALLAPQAFVVQRAVATNPPAVLEHQARDILQTLGYSQKPVDSASGFAVDPAYYAHIQKGPRTMDRAALLARSRMGLVSFWYRQSPDPLIPRLTETGVSGDDPPNDQPGMVEIKLAPDLALFGLEVHTADMPTPPPATESNAGRLVATHVSSLAADWQPLLDAAKIDAARFHPVAPSQVPTVFVDDRAAWEGSFQSAPNEQLHVEAGMLRGRPVYFAMTGDWKNDKLSEVNAVIQTLITFTLLCGGIVLAFTHFRTGKSDRAGAIRIALLFLMLGFVAWVFQAHHVPDVVLEFKMFTRAMGGIMYTVGLVWIFYLALESYVRRVWPETVISWNRMLAGRWIDPLVGRDVLIGAAVGAFIALLNTLERLLPIWIGLPGPMPSINTSIQMLRSATDYSTLFTGAINAVYIGLLLLLLLVLMRMALKRKLLVSIGFILMFVGASAPWGSRDYFSWIVQAMTAVLFLGLMVRHGLVAIIFCNLIRMLLMDFPVTFDFTVWYRNSALCAIGATVLILAVATYAALGGRSLITLRLSER